MSRMLHLDDFCGVNFMPPNADRKYSWLRLERGFEVTARSAVLCGQQGYLEDGKHRGRKRQKKSFE